jgi:excisionase family DNA binding protein
MGHTETKLLTVSEAAESLGLKEATIRRRILERRIPYVKLGRAVRIPLEAINELVKAGYREAIASAKQ